MRQLLTAAKTDVHKAVEDATYPLLSRLNEVHCPDARICCLFPAAAGRANSVPKVVPLLTELQAKIIKDSEAERKAFESYAEWCESGRSTTS